jgi:cell division protein FtsI (penicillin-binding protein 3)
MDGYTVAGKTGTASKLVNQHYSRSDYNASFVGFVPSRNPAAVIVVVIDSPHAKGYYGAVVSAPVFKRIADATLRHLGIGPNVNPAPPVIVARREASDMAATPVAAPVAALHAAETTEPGQMPDLRGLSAREALRTLTRIGLTARMNGDGFVVEQSPAAGALLIHGSACVLTLGRRVPGPAPGAQQ